MTILSGIGTHYPYSRRSSGADISPAGCCGAQKEQLLPVYGELAPSSILISCPNSHQTWRPLAALVWCMLILISHPF